MTDLPTLSRLIRRHRPSLLAIAVAEQRRQVDLLGARIGRAPDHAARAALRRRRDETDILWAELRCWLSDDDTPERPEDIARAVAQAARAAKAKWDEDPATAGRTDHPFAEHFLGLIMLDRTVREDLLPALQRRNEHWNQPSPEGLAA